MAETREAATPEFSVFREYLVHHLELATTIKGK